MKLKTFTFSLAIIASNIAFAQQLKTYEGPFTINHTEGVAKYTYKDAEDGSRIFHGDFIFEEKSKYDYDDGHSRSVKAVKGKFKDNHQVGTWTWTGPWDLGFEESHWSYDNTEQIFTYNFNERGDLDGLATYSRGNNDKYSLTIKNDEIIGSVPFVSENYRGILHATWENGHLVGDYLFKEIERFYSGDKLYGVTEGKFNKEGKPIGTWTEKRRNGEITYIKYSDEGEHLESYYFEPTTGDREKCYSCIYKVEFIPALFRQRGKFLLRDSKK